MVLVKHWDIPSFQILMLHSEYVLSAKFVTKTVSVHQKERLYKPLGLK